MSVIMRPLLNTIHYLRKSAHERPVVFFSIIVGAIGTFSVSLTALGPALVLTVPPMRMRMGWTPAERIPVTYPCMLYIADWSVPERAREAVSGYDDE